MRPISVIFPEPQDKRVVFIYLLQVEQRVAILLVHGAMK